MLRDWEANPLCQVLANGFQLFAGIVVGAATANNNHLQILAPRGNQLASACSVCKYCPLVAQVETGSSFGSSFVCAETRWMEATAVEGEVATAACPAGVITGIRRPLFGASVGGRTCKAPTSYAVVRAHCLGQPSCSVNASTWVFGDPVRCLGGNLAAATLRLRRAGCIQRGAHDLPSCSPQCADVAKHLEFGYMCGNAHKAAPIASTPPRSPYVSLCLSVRNEHDDLPEWV